MGQSPNSRFYNTQGEGIPFFQGKAEFGSLYPTVHKWCSQPTKIAETGDILLSVRAPVGPTNLSKERCCIGRGLAAIRADVPLSQKYLLYYFRHIQPWLTKQGTGSTFASVSGGFLRKLEIPIAPLNEQKRIADKLDKILVRVDACRERLDRIPAILKRFRQAVLAAATSGKLTEEWRENSRNESFWKEINIGELLIDIRYGTTKKCHYEPRATPVIRIPNIYDGKISHLDLKYAEFNDAERQKLSLVTGDILMIRSNGSVDLVGQTALATEADKGFLYAGYLIRLRVNQQIVDPAYLSLALSAPDARYAIELTARSTNGVNNINTEEIKSLVIKLPNLEEQSEIVRRVEELFAYADRIEASYQVARTKVDKLTPAILAKAFRGELVPQNPDEEPASVLLERIQAARTENKVTPKQKRSRNKAANTSASHK